MTEESKYCSQLIKKLYNKELVMTKEDKEDFTKCWICVNDKDVKVRDHYHITGKYRGPAHRGCNINVKLNRSLNNYYDSHLSMQELDKFNPKINVISNGLEN